MVTSEERRSRSRDRESPRPRPTRRAVIASLTAYGFTVPYMVLLVAFGIIPTVYAVFLSLTKDGGFSGLYQFVWAATQFGFVQSMENIASYLLLWLVTLLILTVGVALILHAREGRGSLVLRTIYYIPGSLTGAAAVIMWIFMLDPVVSPYKTVLHALHLATLNDVLVAHNLPFVFANMGLWAAAGGWVLTLLGALGATPKEILDAARVDGCGEVKLAFYIKLPLLRRWIAYQTILAIAAGAQIFVEPQLVNGATSLVPNWSPNQLAYTFAFQANNFNSAAAISIYLLLISVICALIVVTRTGMFSVE